jgi:hypothetical protein
MLFVLMIVRVSSPDFGAKRRAVAAPTRPPIKKPARKLPNSLELSDIVYS